MTVMAAAPPRHNWAVLALTPGRLGRPRRCGLHDHRISIMMISSHGARYSGCGLPVSELKVELNLKVQRRNRRATVAVRQSVTE